MPSVSGVPATRNFFRCKIIALALGLATGAPFARAEETPRKIPAALVDFPKSLTTKWDRNTPTGFAQPSWFPKVSCETAWFSRQSPRVKARKLYQYDFEKYAREKYLSADPATIGCAKDSEKETRRCVLTEAYRDFNRALEEGTASDGQNLPSRKRRDCYKKWTVLVAMDADSDLYPYAHWDLFEMETDYAGAERAGSTLRKDVVVQHDGPSAETFDAVWDEEEKNAGVTRPEYRDVGVRRLHVFQSPQPYPTDDAPPLSRDRFLRETVADRLSPIVEMKDRDYLPSKKERFVDFLRWGMREYPAEHYMVILWGHGKGWLIRDTKGLAHLSGLELAEAMREVHETILEGKRPIDNFVADSCFMQGIELATELSVYTRFISGSAQVQSFLGLPYRTFFYEMNASFARLNDRLKRQARGLDSQGKAEEARELLEMLERLKADEPAAIAYELPHLVSVSLSDRGYQGRVDKAADGYPEGKSFFTFASVDGTALRRDFVPGLEELAVGVRKFLLEDPAKRADRAYQLQDQIPNIQMFRTDLRTRELGSTLGRLKLLGVSFKESDVAGDVARIAHRLETSLHTVIPSAYFAPRYERHKRFRAVGFWLPDNPGDYEVELPAFSETLLFGFNSGVAPAGSSAWKEMLRTLFAE